MMELTKFYARSFDLDHIELFWEVADFSVRDDNPAAYDMEVMQSESPYGPFDTIAGPFQDQYFLRVPCPPNLHKWRKIFYKLKITDSRTSEVKEYGPTAQLSEPDLIALEIQRQEEVLFREYSGRKVWLFPVRTFGAVCSCYDPVSDRRMRSNCLTCYDVGYLGGYLSPIQAYVQLDPDAKKPQLSSLGEMQNRNTTGRLISFPPIKPKDILVETENRRWRVVSVVATERLRAVVHQELVLHEIPQGDIEYKLPLNVDTTTLDPSAPRNYSNPHNLDQDEDLQRALAAIGTDPRGTTR